MSFELKKTKQSEPTWFSNLWWNRPPLQLLNAIEKEFFEACNTQSVGFYVDVTVDRFEGESELCRIWTRKFNKTHSNSDASQSNAKDTPLVLLHGMGAGGAFFSLNVDGLAKFSTVYLIDLPGFAKSSRFAFNKDPEECEKEYISLLEKWSEKLNLESFNICGHSFGGYIASLYSLEHPQRINNLLLADPWGYGILPEITPLDPEYISPRTGQKSSLLFRLLAQILLSFNPLAMYRLFGRLSLYFLSRLRTDLSKPYDALWSNKNDNVLYKYVHYCNLQAPSGEDAFWSLSRLFAWAKNPMIKRIHKMDPSIPMTVIYGKNSWMKHITLTEFIEARGVEDNTRVEVVEDARHHVYAHQPEKFNQIIIDACTRNSSRSL